MGGTAIGGVERLRQMGISVDESDLNADRVAQQMESTLYELRQGRGSLADAEALLQRASEARAQMPSGATIDRLQGLSEQLTGAIGSRRRDSAIDDVHARRTPDYRGALERDMGLGAAAMRRTDDPATFAGLMVRGGSDARMRALSGMSEGQLRTALAREGIEGDRADAAISALKQNIALRFQRRVHTQAERGLRRATSQLERAAIGQGHQFESRLSELTDPQRGDELVRGLRQVGAEAIAGQLGQLRGELAAHPERRDSIVAQMRPLLARGLRHAADAVSERHEEVRHGAANNAIRAESSMAFPSAAFDVEQRWGADGLVSDAIEEHVAAAREEYESDAFWGGIILVGAAAIVAPVTGGQSFTAAAAAGGMAAFRESMDVGTAFARAEDAAAEAAAGMREVDEAEQLQQLAETKQKLAPAVVAGEALAGGLIGGAHHEIAHGVTHGAVQSGRQVVGRAMVEAGAIGADQAAAAAVHAAKHAAEHAAAGDGH